MNWIALHRQFTSKDGSPLVAGMRIARTEATRLSNSAAQSAMDEGRDIGLTIYKMWDTAGDDLVRDSHMALDGQVVASDEDFQTEA